MIRPATAADVGRLGEVWDESARAGFASLLPPDHPFPAFDRQRFLELLADDAVRTLVSEAGGQVLGHTTFGSSRDPDAQPGVGEVRSFFVRSSAWRRGLGRELMAAALEGLSELGYVHATLWSFDANERANGFYESAGFTRDGTERTEEAWAYIPEVRYRRALA